MVHNVVLYLLYCALRNQTVPQSQIDFLGNSRHPLQVVRILNVYISNRLKSKWIAVECKTGIPLGLISRASPSHCKGNGNAIPGKRNVMLAPVIFLYMSRKTRSCPSDKEAYLASWNIGSGVQVGIVFSRVIAPCVLRGNAVLLLKRGCPDSRRF